MMAGVGIGFFIGVIVGSFFGAVVVAVLPTDNMSRGDDDNDQDKML